MDSTRLHLLVKFVDDIEVSASEHARLLGGTLERRDRFIMLRAGALAIGFHPSDERSPTGTIVPYFITEDLDCTLEDARNEGHELYRGPITVGNERIMQVRNMLDVTIGYVKKL